MSDHTPSATPSPSLWIVILCLLISLVGIIDHDLWTPDEPREAAIMLSMSRTGHLLIPSLAGAPFVEKPPLYYIAGAGALRLLGPVLGPTEALRLTSALWGLGALAMTWLLARRLLGRDQGIWAMVILATLPGFIHVTHWMLVDNALMFFVTAALWCFAEVYIGARLGFLPWAAVFTGGAFLSKGFIGPLIIGLGWLALVFSWRRQVGWRGMMHGRSLGLHGLAFLLFLALSASWMIALRTVGGSDLWKEWFWANHLGRFSGSAVQLGHRQGPWYYLPVLLIYLLPWLAFVLVGIKNLLAALFRGDMTPAGRVLAAWALGGLLVLSLAATKRDIYLSVLLPALAIIAASMIRLPISQPLQNTLWLWAGCMLGAMLVVVIAPLLGQLVQVLTGGWGWYQVIAGCTILACCLLFYRVSRIRFISIGGVLRPAATVSEQVSFLSRHLTSILYRPLPVLSALHAILAATALFFIAGLTILFPMMDRVKSYGPAFHYMVERMAADPSARLAGWQFDETTRAGFYYYCDLVFPALSDINALNQVLEKRHSQFNGILALSRNFPPESGDVAPWHVREKVQMGPRRALEWIEGANGNRVAKPPDQGLPASGGDPAYTK